MIKILKINIIIFLGLMAIYHILPYSNTFTNVLYYFADHELKIVLLLFIWHQYRYNEFLYAAIYFIIKLIYHLLLLNKAYSEYLNDLQSEIYAMIMTIVLLGLFIIKHEKIHRKKLCDNN